MESHVTLRFFKPNRPIVVVGCLIGMAILNGCTTSPTRPGLYLVQPGEFLEKIAADSKQNVHELADWNDIPWPYTPLNPGWQIRTDRPADYVSRLKFYEAVPGDTWEKIASKVNQPVGFLKEWNRRLAPECCAIDPGLKLLVSPPRGYLTYDQYTFRPPSLNSSCTSQKWATVKKGKMMTWYDVLVRQCGCPQSVAEDMQARKGSNGLRPGQKICCDCAKP